MLVRALNLSTSVAATVSRMGFGIFVADVGPRPSKRLRLFEFEGYPFCRKVREVLSVLDLEADIYPCPKGGPRFRVELDERAGRQQFPYLIDDSQGVEMYESSVIIEHLYKHYSTRAEPPPAARFPLNSSVFLVGALRATAGTFYRPSRVPDRPLELYSFESSPFSRLVRERMCELELPYHLHNVAKGSSNREQFENRAGKIMVPYLVDPNTDVAMFESADIISYLEDTYALS